MTTDQLVLATPIDVARQVDHTTRQSEIDSGTFLGSADDRESLRAFLEDAEDEFRQVTDADMRLGRVGTPGARETYEQATHKVSGHEATKQSMTGVWRSHSTPEGTISLDNNRVLPFDPDAGDAAFVDRGLDASGDRWEEITDDYGESWDILNHREGTLRIHPRKLFRSMGHSWDGIPGTSRRRKRVRIALSYRYGSLGGDRGRGGLTELGTELTADETTIVAVADASRLPVGEAAGSILLRVGTEYVRATINQDSDEIEVTRRGARNSETATWASGTTVHYVPPAIIKAVASRAAMNWITTGRGNKFIPDNETDVSETAMYEQLQETWSRTVDSLQ